MMNNTGIKRISYLDSLKGILIISVIIGHSNVNLIIPHLTQTIYSFHMPLFFILSGFFLHRKENIFNHLKKSYKAYIKPYIYTCLVSLLLIIIKYIITNENKYISFLLLICINHYWFKQEKQLILVQYGFLLHYFGAKTY